MTIWTTCSTKHLEPHVTHLFAPQVNEGVAATEIQLVVELWFSDDEFGCVQFRAENGLAALIFVGLKSVNIAVCSARTQQRQGLVFRVDTS